MIVDATLDPARAMLYSVLDIDTGRWLEKELAIIYADDEAGTYIILRQDANGHFYPDPDDPGQMAREVRRGRIKLCLKPHHESEEQGLALYTAEQERARIDVEEGRARERMARRERIRRGDHHDRSNPR
jgi:hypothetical protein